MILFKRFVGIAFVVAVVGVAIVASPTRLSEASLSITQDNTGGTPAQFVDDPVGTPAPAQTTGNQYYVATNGNNGWPGTVSQPWRTIQYAAGRVVAGDVVWIRGGTYVEQVTPANSGQAGRPITYKAYPGEQPIIDGQNNSARLYNILLVNRRFITFDGIRVEEPWVSWVLIENSDYITMQNMQFMNPTYPSSMQRNFWGIDIRNSNNNRITSSVLDRWGRYQEGDSEGNHIGIHGNNNMTRGIYNVIEYNTFTYGAQGCIILNASYNVIRNNTFYNDWQKGIYVGWFTNPGGEPAGTDWVAYRNLIENNQFIRSNNSQYDHGGLGIESTAAGTIMRRNVMRNNDHFGLIVTVFGNGYALRDWQTHIYNNTIVYNGLDRFQYRGHGLTISNHGLGLELHDTIVKNNIIYGNLTHADGNVNHINIEVTGSANNPPHGRTVFAGNLIENPRPTTCQNNINRNGQGGADCPIYMDGVGSGNVAFWQARYPTYFYGNREGNPGFASYDPANGVFDLTLTAGSLAIDAGSPLTATRSGGTGNVLPVWDAYYFADSYGGMIQPDIIRVGNSVARIVSIDINNHNITLDRTLTWTANAYVNLQYFGTGPDIGAYEFSQPDTVVLFNPAIPRAALLNTLQDLPPNSAYTVFDTGSSFTTGRWVMGDWNADGLRTLGVFNAGAFYYTNDYGQSVNWTGIWIGPNGIPVSGRFSATSPNDCIGVVDSANFPPYGTAFALYFTCNLTSGPTPPLTYQWLSVLLPDSQGFSGVHQFGAGDFDGDGVDSIAVRRGPYISYTNVPPTTVNSAFNYAQYIGAPSTNDYGTFVVGDWNSDLFDTFGLVYNNGNFYRRNDLAWNSGQYFLQRVGQPIGSSITAATWRSGGGEAGTSGVAEVVAEQPSPEATPSILTERRLVESDDPLVTPIGQWTAVDSPDASGERYLTALGEKSGQNSLTIEFSGTALEVVYLETPEPGAFTIMVDDVAVRTIIIPGGITQPLFNQRSVISYLEPGPHTLKIVAIDGTVAIDAFDLTVLVE